MPRKTNDAPFQIDVLCQPDGYYQARARRRGTPPAAWLFACVATSADEARLAATAWAHRRFGFNQSSSRPEAQS